MKVSEGWQRLVAGARRLLDRAGRLGRVGAAALLVVLVALGVLALARWGEGPEFAPLFAGLRPEDMGEVVAALRQAGVAYRLSDDGTTVLVPTSEVYRARLDLAEKGLPRGGVVGFEIFDRTSLGMTDFERQVRYQRALEGELVRTVRHLNEVRDARVHIVMPQESPFVRERRPATASVLLDLYPGASLRPGQVRGIAHLVARSVAGLTPDQVTIVDTSGNVLSDRHAPPEADGALAQRLQVQRQVEEALAQSVESMLGEVYGQDRVVARVSATLNFDVTEENSELFLPAAGGRGVLRSSEEVSERGTGIERLPEGPPGVESNIPGYVAEARTGAGGSYQRDSKVQNFEISRTQRYRMVVPGRLERLSVAVFIDGELGPEELDRIQGAVAAAVGLDPSRGDQITVESMRFGARAGMATGELLRREAGAAEGHRGWWPVAAIVLAVGILTLFILAFRRRRAPRPGAPGAGAEPAPVALPEPAEAPPREPTLQEQLERLAREEPQEVARVLETWLTEG